MPTKAELAGECQGCNQVKTLCTYCKMFGHEQRTRLCRRCHETALGVGRHEFTTEKQEDS